jgi:hypothetical protein
MRRFFAGASAAWLLLLAGCFDDTSMMPAEDVDGLETLIEHSWSLEPGEEKIWCVRQTLSEDIYIDYMEAFAPPGSHHTVLSAGFGGLADDGEGECGANDHNFANLVFESSSSLNPLVMPEGVASKISAGMQLNFNYHVFNATDRTLSGTTGVKVRRVDPSQIEQLATETRFGKTTLEVPPGESVHTQECAIDADGTFFAVLPHMHFHGTHLKLVAHSSVVGEKVVLDEPYRLDATKAYYQLAEEIPVKKGDVVTITCTYFNETPWTLHWGPAAYEAEMCFAGVYLYPAEGHNSFCAL